jgi:hypothetical protein
MEYERPKVDVGQIVYWYMAAGSEPFAAIVTSMGARNLGLSIFGPGYSDMMTRDGVLHVSDPNADDSVDNDSGLWDYAPTDPRRDGIRKSPRTDSKAESSASVKRGPGRPRKTELAS